MLPKQELLLRLQARAAHESCSVDALLTRWLDEDTSQSSLPYHAILNRTSDVIVLLDRTLRLVYANDSIQNIVSLSPQQLQGTTYADWGAARPMIDMLVNLTQEVISTGQEKRQTFPFIGVKGTRLYEARFSPLLDTAGEVQYVLCIARNITAHQHAQDQLRRSEANLRAILNSTAQSFILIDLNYRVVDTDDKTKQSSAAIFGKTMQMGDSIYDFVLESDHANFTQNFARARQGERVTAEKVFQDHVGAEVHYDITYYPVIDVHGAIIGVCMSTENVTEQKRAVRALAESEKALSRSEARLRSLVETQSAFVVRSDLAGNYTYANRAFTQLYSWLGDNLTGLSLMQTILPIDHEKTIDTVMACLERPGQPQQVILRKIMSDETWFWSLWEFVAIQDANHIVTEIQCIGFDITKQIQAEQDRLEQERLKSNLKKEQLFNALIQRAVSTLSHDIRIPLSVISLAKDMLERHYEKLTEDKRREKLASIGRQLHYVVEMLDDVTMTVQGRLQENIFKPEIVNLAALCQICVYEIQETIGVRHQLRFISDDTITTALIDETLVSRILLNLLSNAVKFSPEMSEIRLELSQQDDRIVVRVVDQGMGISEHDLQYIFDPLYRASAAQHIRGTGLGLNIVKECVEYHQGQILVESQVGLGTTFTVELPLKVKAAVE